jgi:ATP-dependent protease HslVU (ClpYQ) peptidase subunit
MTTVVCDRNEMGTDSQASDEVVKSSVVKSWRVRGTIVGVAGTYANAVSFVAWLKKKVQEEPYPDMEGVCALVLKKDGIWVFDEVITPYKIQDPYAAIGSGAQAALAAMSLGCNVRESVGVAKKIDPCTGGRINVKTL